MNPWNSSVAVVSRLAVMLLLTLLPVQLSAAGRVPERLVYDLSWMGIPVGSATQEIGEDGGARKIVSTARSNAWLSAFFPVDDRTETLLGKTGPFPGEPRLFRMHFREGSRVRNREITFSRAAGSALFHDRVSGERLRVPITADTLDIYSSFYFVRNQPLTPGSSITISVLDGKQLHRIVVRVIGRERVTVPAGAFDTIKIEPLVKAEGVFEGKRGVYIWLSDDERRIPVKAQTRVTVGSVTAVLTSVGNSGHQH